MKFFFKKIAIFTLLATLVINVGFFLPTTPRAAQSYLYSIILKDSLLANVDSPRMIFIGGSNISFGLNSQMIKDSLNVNPINTGINAGIGLKFMFDNTLQYIRKGDIIIAPLEYSYSTHEYDYGSEALVRIVMDVNRGYLRLLNFQQIFTLLPFIPKYFVSKLNPLAYFNIEINHPQYSINSFNQYGDEYAHWNMKNRTFVPSDRLDDFNQQIIEKIKDFEKNVTEKGAKLYLTYPSYLDRSFHKSEDIIVTIQTELEKNFKVLGTPERYMMPDSLMFDTSYHLNKKGVDIRTARLIEDIRKAKVQ
ncbi:MAG: hypothetical protein LBS55_13020 [Prevotellaceae bacterium]|jgi:hypothetical protein|nr:hypothetical protein [Prevotellaceae bacterium]